MLEPRTLISILKAVRRLVRIVNHRMFISVLGVKMRLFKVIEDFTIIRGVEAEHVSYVVAPTEDCIEVAFTSIEEVKLEGGLIPLPTLEQLVKMGIAERWDD